MSQRSESEPKELEPSTALNVVLLPDEAVSTHAIELSRRTAEIVPVEFTLNTSNFKPHITLYQGYYPDRNLGKLKDELARFSKSQEPVRVSLQGSEVVIGTFIFWSAAKAPEIRGLHEGILEIGNVLRDGQIPPNVQALTDLSEEDLAMIAQTGGILNRHRHNPHITITRVQNPDDAQHALSIVQSAPPMEFQARSITLAHLGPHGTISEIVEEFPFGK